MRLFLKRIFGFAVLMALLNTVVILANYFLVRSQKIEIPEGKSVLVLGDSNTEFAINDSILSRAYNFSASSDSYYYSYIKLNILLDTYGGFDTLLLAFAPHNIFDNGWLLKKSHIYTHFRSYYPFMKKDEFFFLFRRKPFAVISSISSVIREFGANIIKGIENQNIFLSYGGYQSLERDDLKEVQRRLITGEELPFFDLPESDTISMDEIVYLNKILNLCHKNDINVILINTPKRFELLEYDKYGVDKFREFYSEEYSNIDYLDYSEMRLPDRCYSDFVHLNYIGSRIFSQYMNVNGLTDYSAQKESLE